MPIILRILETYKCLYGITSGIFGLKYQSEAAVLVKFAALEWRRQQIEEITNINPIKL